MTESASKEVRTEFKANNEDTTAKLINLVDNAWLGTQVYVDTLPKEKSELGADVQRNRYNRLAGNTWKLALRMSGLVSALTREVRNAADLSDTYSSNSLVVAASGPFTKQLFNADTMSYDSVKVDEEYLDEMRKQIGAKVALLLKIGQVAPTLTVKAGETTVSVKPLE